MNFRQIKPIISSKQIKETIAYYPNMLGFTCRAYREEWGWAAMQRDDVEVILAYPNQHYSFEKPNFTGSFYIETEEVDFLWEELKNKVNILNPLEILDQGMREFAIPDNNGYILQFRENLLEIKM